MPTADEAVSFSRTQHDILAPHACDYEHRSRPDLSTVLARRTDRRTSGSRYPTRSDSMNSMMFSE